MWKKGENVLIYGGKSTFNGFKPSIIVGEILEIGEDHLLVRFRPSGHFGFGKVGIVDKKICRNLEKNINMYDINTSCRVPSVGDLVNHFKLDFDGKIKVNEIGTVQCVSFIGPTVSIEIMIDGKMKSVNADNCLILQRANKIPNSEI